MYIKKIYELNKRKLKKTEAQSSNEIAAETTGCGQ
jgi:hypothetical protein